MIQLPLRITRIMNETLKLGIAGIAVLSFSGSSIAADLDLLTRLLIPGYIAQDFASVCSVRDTHFLAEGIDGFDSVASYAEHLKKEITVNLSEQDATRVQVSAANVARDVARSELTTRSLDGNATSGRLVRQWCDNEARKFILSLASAHAKQHKKFDFLVQSAVKK